MDAPWKIQFYQILYDRLSTIIYFEKDFVKKCIFLSYYLSNMINLK